LPDEGYLTGEPFKRELRFLYLTGFPKQGDADPITKVHHWWHGDRITDPDKSQGKWQVAANPDHEQHTWDHLKGNGQKTAKQANQSSKRN
jgi:hypothetical protein